MPETEDHVLRFRMRFAEGHVTHACMHEDFTLRRGVKLRFAVEKLRDALMTDGEKEVASEIGHMVLGAMDAISREEAKGGQDSRQSG
jgi:hypothetical protein